MRLGVKAASDLTPGAELKSSPLGLTLLAAAAIPQPLQREELDDALEHAAFSLRSVFVLANLIRDTDVIISGR